MSGKTLNDRIAENLLDDLKQFPVRFRREAKAVGQAFAHPSISTTMSQMDRRALMDTLMGAMASREGLMSTLDSVRHNDIVQTILRVVTDDAFYTSEGEIFEVTYDEGKEEESDTQKRVNDMIAEFVDTRRLVPLIKTIIDDLLLYGEYPIRVLVSPRGHGVTALKDDLDPVKTVGIYEIDEPLFFLQQTASALRVRDPREVVHFTLAPMKVRIKSTDLYTNETSVIPEYIRTGRSILFPALQRIRQLQTIEMAALIRDLKRAIAPTLISVSVPPGTLPEEVTEIVKKYEQHLQETYRGMPDLDNPTMGDIFSTALNFRAVPNFTDGKGALQTLDPMGPQEDIDTRIDRMRQAIAMAVGIPPYYLVVSNQETTQSRTEMLKLHGRYSRMLVDIQDALASGIRRLVALHINNSNLFIDDHFIQVKFKQVINTDHLDQMEYAVASAQSLRDLFAGIQEILASDEVNAELDQEEFLAMVNRFLLAGDLTDKPLLRKAAAPPAAEGEGGGGGGLFGGGGGGGGGGLLGGGGGPGPLPGADEAPLFDAEGGFEGDEMENTEPLPPPDFGEPEDFEDEGGPGAEGGPEPAEDEGPTASNLDLSP